MLGQALGSALALGVVFGFYALVNHLILKRYGRARPQLAAGIVLLVLILSPVLALGGVVAWSRLFP